MMPHHWRPLAHERNSIFKCKQHTCTLHDPWGPEKYDYTMMYYGATFYSRHKHNLFSILDDMYLTLNSFSSYTFICLRLCLFRAPFWTNRLPHTLHANGFSPVCTRMWFSRFPRELNTLWQVAQQNIFPRTEIKNSSMLANQKLWYFIVTTGGLSLRNMFRERVGLWKSYT